MDPKHSVIKGLNCTSSTSGFQTIQSNMNLMIHNGSTSSIRGGSRISRKGVHMYMCVGAHFADFISFILNIQ